MKTIYSLIIVCILAAMSTFSFAQENFKSAMKKNNERFKDSEIRCDVRFASYAAEANLTDMAFGQLAQTKASNAQVRDLGKSMYDGHSKANTELKELADKKGIALPTEMCKSAKKHYDKLAKKTGADFDKAYVKCVVKGHKHEIKCGYLREAEKGKEPSIRQWAADKLPTLYQHLAMGKDACKALKPEIK